MGGVIDWHALDILIPMYGHEDPQLLVEQLLVIRDFLREQNASESKN